MKMARIILVSRDAARRSPGRALTHWKAPPSHGARK
jgi:hypothetical protein